MKTFLAVLLVLGLGVLPGCSAWMSEDGADAAARRQLDLAQRLQASGALREATLEYTIIAEQYPKTDAYGTAVRKAAYLYASPVNPSRNDSIASEWLAVHLGLDISTEEREGSALLIERIRETFALRREIARHSEVADSLASVTRGLSTGSLRLSRQIDQLQGELRETREELEKLKEIDAQTSKSRRRR